MTPGTVECSPEWPATGLKGGTPVYLYNRQLTIKPDSLRAGSAALVDAVSHLNANSSNQFALWQGLLGAPVGTFGASCRIDSYGDFTDEVARLYAEDEAYVDKVETMGTHMDGSATDSLWNIVHAVGEQGEVPNVCSVVRFKVIPAELKAGMAMAVEMVDFFHSIHGAPMTASMSMWGEASAIGIIGGYESVQQFEEGSRAVQSEGSFFDRLEANAVGIPGSNMHGVMRRIV